MMTQMLELTDLISLTANMSRLDLSDLRDDASAPCKTHAGMASKAADRGGGVAPVVFAPLSGQILPCPPAVPGRRPAAAGCPRSK